MHNSKMDHIKNRRLPQSEGKVRKISQPVKIAQLLGPSVQSQTGLKNSAIKISQPERITPYLKNISTQKKNKGNTINRLHHSEKNVRRNLKFTETPTTTRNVKKVTKTNTSNLCNILTKNEKRLNSSNRKSLLLPPNTIKDMHIRNSTKQSKSMLPGLNQTRVLTAYSANKYPRISEGSENSPLVESINAPIDHLVHENNKTSVIQYTSSRVFHGNNQSGINSLHSSPSDLTDANNDTGKKILKYLNSVKISDINNDNDDKVTSNVSQLYSTYNIDRKVDIELHNGSYLDLEANAVCTLPGADKINNELHSIRDVETLIKEKCSSTTMNDYRENIHVSLQAIETLNKSSVNSQHGVNDNNEYVTLDKKEFTILASHLKHIICKLEEDVSHLKLMSTFITNALSSNAIDEMTNNNDTENKQQMTKHLVDGTEVVNITNTKSCITVPCSAFMDSIDTEDNTQKETCKTLNFNISNLSEIDVFESAGNNFEVQSPQQIDLVVESNKENEENPNLLLNAKQLRSETRRRSARLIEKALKNSSAANDSFVNLENELNITNVKSDLTTVLHKNYTPVASKCKDKKTGRPWKEYMVLKSRMSCLLTPNIKRFNSSSTENNTHHEVAEGASLSNKILAELHNLYADSPDAQ